MTTKQIRHMEMRENSVREWVNDQLLRALHVKVKINPADTFTKEMRDGAHFRRLRDCFMCRLSDFLLVDVHLSHQQDEPVLHQIMPSAASSSFSVIQGSYLSILYSLPLCNTLLAISHLLSAGRQLINSLHRIVPSVT